MGYVFNCFMFNCHIYGVSSASVSLHYLFFTYFKVEHFWAFQLALYFPVQAVISTTVMMRNKLTPQYIKE